MLWYIPIAAAGMACLGVLTVVASTAAGRSAGRHVLTDPQEEWDAYVAEVGSYGSMVLAEEQHHEEWLPAPAVDPEPWRAQMTAELSPETLDVDEAIERASESDRLAVAREMGWLDPPPLPPDLSGDLDAIPPNRIDPGPGDAAVEPPASSGPDQPPVARSDGAVAGSIPALTLGGRVFDPPGQPGQPSRWLAEQLEILRAWSERQQAYAEILA